MPSEKFKISKASRSIRHGVQNLFSTFSILNTSQEPVNYPIGVDGIIPATFQEDPATHSDRRSAHNALERQRRETLNSKFQELAHALPALQSCRRPSKTMIVSTSLDFVSKSLQRENSYVNQIKDLRKQNERLRKQAKAAKVLMMKQQQKKKYMPTSSTSSNTSNHTSPSLSSSVSSHSSSSNTSSHRMQRSSTMSTTQSNLSTLPENEVLVHYQMSPPLTPETPNKPCLMIHQTSQPSVQPSVQPSMIQHSPPYMDQLDYYQQQQQELKNNIMVSSPLQWSNQQDLLFMSSPPSTYSSQPICNNNQQHQHNNNYVMGPPVYTPMNTTQPIQHYQQALMPYTDNMNTVLFSPYPFQDTTVYHDKPQGNFPLA
ncbi:unnamed protein product [Cunninghamella blakesleeana]